MRHGTFRRRPISICLTIAKFPREIRDAASRTMANGHRRHCTGESAITNERECPTFTQYARKRQHSLPTSERARIRDRFFFFFFFSFEGEYANQEMEGITEDGWQIDVRGRLWQIRRTCTLKEISDFRAYGIPILFSNKHSNVRKEVSHVKKWKLAWGNYTGILFTRWVMVNLLE